MRASTPLFRPAAMRSRNAGSSGEIVLAQPLSFLLLTAAAVGIACAILAFLCWGSYTEHSTLSGRLMPDRGVIKIRAPRYGVIAEKLVAEGEHVERGDVLYVVSGERTSAAIGAAGKSMARELARRARAVEDQIAEARALAAIDRAATQRAMALLDDEAERLRASVGNQRSRVELADESLSRYARMESAGFVSQEQRIVTEQDLLEQRGRLQSLEREQARLREQRAELVHEVAVLPIKTGHQIADLKRALARIRQESIENEAQRRISVVAPAAGVVTAVLAAPGQSVDSGRVLASILPQGARLQARLDAPSRAAGFIDVGDTVLLRYQAYPYQKYGHRTGRVVSISRTALSPIELAGDATAASLAAEPEYRVIVELDSQSMLVGGRRRPLLAGMAVEADVLQGTRRLYEWVLEPLYSYSRRPQ